MEAALAGSGSANRGKTCLVGTSEDKFFIWENQSGLSVGTNAAKKLIVL